MAKKSNSSIGGSGSIFDILNEVDNNAEVLSESKTAVIKDYIDTGSYILNACISGSLFKGVPTGRVITLSGEPGTGKTFLALSICRKAQKKGYIPIYMDSEGAIDIEFVKRLGCDTSRFIVKQVTTVSEVSTFMANILKKMMEQDEDKRDKVMFVLDSLGNLTSEKELNDTIEASGRKDMTRNQDIKALFRTNATALAKTGSLFVVNTHTYKTLDLYSKSVVSGGCLVPDTKIKTSNGLVEIKNIKVGDFVLDENGEYSEVLKTFKYIKPTIAFTFSDGSTLECSRDHKFKVEGNNGIYLWKKASELNEKDFIIEITE